VIGLAFQYLALIRMERTSTEAAIEFLEHWLSSLTELESRAKAIIQQIRKLIELSR